MNAIPPPTHRLFIWLNLQCFTYLGMGAMNLTPNMPACVALTSLFVLLWNLFCGFLIYRDVRDGEGRGRGGGCKDGWKSGTWGLCMGGLKRACVFV